MLKLFGKPSEDDVQLDLNTRVAPHIRIINGALDEAEDSASPLVLNGRVDQSTLHHLKVDSEYQRALSDRSDIFNALKEGRVVPNIEVGVRGQDFITEGADFIIRSPAYIIDGWQRTGNALRLLQLMPHIPLRIFATVHFGTSREWEQHRFTELNKNVKRISPNLHMKNLRERNDAVLTLYGLSTRDADFPLYKRVSWAQNFGRGELISALLFGLSIYYLHGHRAGFNGRSVDHVAAGLKLISQRITLPTFRRNAKTFIQLIDECWPLAALEKRTTATQIKGSFICELARMLSNHAAFWEHNDNTLVVSADDRRKLAKFSLRDPQVVQLAGSGGASRQILYRLLVDHMNGGRRTNRLRSREESEN
jgi:hypothetical protein